MAFDIQLTDLKKSFHQTIAVDDLSLQVRQGEMLGLIGPDGAGKTTILRILCGLLLADAGECVGGGKDVRRELKAIRSFIGYMPQRFSLYPDLTVAENLTFFADLFRVKKNEREIQLQRLLEFNRLSPFSDRQAQALSGGMKQKLALSCTLIHKPKILLLDEPTTGVDPVSRHEFWNILKDLRAGGITIMVTTPYMDEAARCNRVAFINKGKILLITEPENIAGYYQKTLLEIVCERNILAAKILEASRQFDSVHSFGDRIHISCYQDRAAASQLIENSLSTNNIKIESIKKVSAGIEDVFVELLK